MVDLQKKKKEEKEEARRKFTLDLQNQKESSLPLTPDKTPSSPPPSKEVNSGNNLMDDTKAILKKKLDEIDEIDAIDNRTEEDIFTKDKVKPNRQDKPETGSMSDGLRDALMYLGPRLGGLLIGGYEGYQEADKLATGFQKYQQGQQGTPKKYQQLQDLRDEFGRPLTFDPSSGQPLDINGKPYHGPFIDPVTKRKVTGKGWKDVRDERSTIKTAVKEYNKLANVSEQTLKQVNASNILLGKDGGEVSKLAPGVVARALARLAGEVGRLTEEDVKAFEGNPSIPAKFRRMFKRATTGTMTTDDVNIMVDALGKLEKAERQYMRDAASRISGQYGDLHTGLSSDKLFERIYIPSESKQSEQQPQQENSRVASALDKIKRAKEGKR